jgi:disulfide bond formation protein DsbB
MRNLTLAAPLLLMLASAALLGGAFAFQYLGGLFPCELCVWQRYPHGAVIVLAFIAVLLARGSMAGAVPWLVTLIGLVLLAEAGIAGFHVGVEQGWWHGTEACAGPGVGGSLAETLKGASSGPSARCDEVAWSLFGISMAGYNFGISALLAFFAFVSAERMRQDAR